MVIRGPNRYDTDKEFRKWIPLIQYMDREEANLFYLGIMAGNNQDNVAYLGCIDRFFLFVHLLGRSDGNNEWVFQRCREVGADPDGHIDLWARFHYKSSIITFAGIIQEILIDPELTVAIFSHTKDIAQAFLDQIKTELENNTVLKSIYKDVLWEDPTKQAQKWSKADGIVIKRKTNPKEATVEAHGLIDGQPVSRHYGLMVYDDIITGKAVTSPEQIKKTTLAWENSDNLSKAESNRKWTAGTRWSFGDTYGIIIERKSLKPRIYPATDNGKLNGRPVFLSPQRWAEIKSTQKSTVSAQMLLNPVAGNEAMFQVEWFRGYEVIPANMNVYIMCDPSKGRSKDSDRTAIAVIGIDQASNKYLLDGYRHRMRLSDRYLFLKQLHKKWTDHPGVQMVRVGYEIYGQQADAEVIEEYMQRDNVFFEIIELNYPRQGEHSKNSRVERLEPDMKSGRFFIPSVVWHPDVAGVSGNCQWTVWTDAHADLALQRGVNYGYQVGQIVYTPMKGLTKQQQYQYKTGQMSRIVYPVRRLSEDKEVYDLTRAFMEEARFFPFAPHDDLVDVISRIYDMDVQPPVAYEASMTTPMNEDDISHLREDGSGGSMYDA